MIKTNIKMRVTPEQSKKVQEICFENGIRWISIGGRNGTTLQYLNEPFLYINDDNTISYGATYQEEYFSKDKNKEVSAELFIRTNGTCVKSKTKLLQDIKAMKEKLALMEEKLALMEEELNKPEEFKHFPGKGEYYHYYMSNGTLCSNTASNDDLKVKVFKTRADAHKAYKKAVALEKIKRRLLELQDDWEPNWKDNDERKVYICYRHNLHMFESIGIYSSQSFKDIPYMKSRDIANIIIKEMEDELKLIFDIA